MNRAVNIILIIATVIFLVSTILKSEDTVFPSSGYCIELGLTPSYSKINNQSLEYCPINNFCTGGDNCFTDLDLKGNTFNCCTYKTNNPKCGNNTCNGLYLGDLDSNGCRLYAKEFNHSFTLSCGGYS